MIPQKLSEEFRVIPADRADFDALYALYRSNQNYFDYFSLTPTKERLTEDMTMLPDGCDKEQKHFLVYYDEDDPTALLDLIEKYPDKGTCYIGLFMVDAARQGHGVGTRIITELCAALGELGYKALRLAYGKRYDSAAHFWRKNGFIPLREAKHEEYGELIVAERQLRERYTEEQ